MEQVGTLTLDPSEASELLELVSDEYCVEVGTVHNDGNINFVVNQEDDAGPEEIEEDGVGTASA